jgi:hypothetical protein
VLHRSPARLAHFCFALGAVQAAAALTWGLALIVLLPLGPGRALLHDLWVPTSQLLPPATLTVGAACFTTSAAAGLRAMGAATRSLRAQLATAVAYLLGGIGGVVVAGALGTSWGVTAAVAFGALVGWHQLRAALAAHLQGEVSRFSPVDAASGGAQP